jgi:hypothetical protein
MGAIGPGVTSIEEVLEFPEKKMSKGAKIYSPEIGCLLIW